MCIIEPDPIAPLFKGLATSSAITIVPWAVYPLWKMHLRQWVVRPMGGRTTNSRDLYCEL